MSTTVKYRRRGNKKNSLFKTVEYTAKNPTQHDWGAFDKFVQSCNLRSQLDEVEALAKEILEAHKLPSTWPDFLPYRRQKHALPMAASYALDIAFHVHLVRNWVEKNNPEEAAYMAYGLGYLVAAFHAESGLESRQRERTSNARSKKSSDKDERHERIRKIAKEHLDWDGVTKLKPSERRELLGILKAKFPTYKSLGQRTWSKDMEELGMNGAGTKQD